MTGPVMAPVDGDAVAPEIAIGMAAGEAGAVEQSLKFLAVHIDPAVTTMRLDGTGPDAFNALTATGGGLVVLLEASEAVQ